LDCERPQEIGRFCYEHDYLRWKRRQNIRYALFFWMGQEVCQSCGIADRDVLTIDHIRRNRKAHWAWLGARTAGTEFYRRVLERGMHPDFPLQVLCWNCHVLKDLYRHRGMV